MSISAMKQALEALEEINELSRGPSAICLPAEIDTAMDALRQAIAEAEKQEPVAWAKFNQGEITHSEMTDGSGCDFDLKAAGFVPLYTAPVHASDTSQERVDQKTKDRHEPDDDIYDVWKEKGA